MTDQDPKTGKFVAGNKASPGRPPKQREERYREILISTVTYEDWTAIIGKATEQAKRGDAVARKWLSDYLIGPPVQKTEVESKSQLTIVPQEVDYRSVAAALAPRPIHDSDAPSEGENPIDGQTLG